MQCKKYETNIILRNQDLLHLLSISVLCFTTQLPLFSWTLYQNVYWNLSAISRCSCQFWRPWSVLWGVWVPCSSSLLPVASSLVFSFFPSLLLCSTDWLFTAPAFWFSATLGCKVMWCSDVCVCLDGGVCMVMGCWGIICLSLSYWYLRINYEP